jgi:hypothetical protein
MTNFVADRRKVLLSRERHRRLCQHYLAIEKYINEMAHKQASGLARPASEGGQRKPGLYLISVIYNQWFKQENCHHRWRNPGTATRRG